MDLSGHCALRVHLGFTQCRSFDMRYDHITDPELGLSNAGDVAINAATDATLTAANQLATNGRISEAVNASTKVKRSR